MKIVPCQYAIIAYHPLIAAVVDRCMGFVGCVGSIRCVGFLFDVWASLGCKQPHARADLPFGVLIELGHDADLLSLCHVLLR
jgi:hypothetical protein